MLKKIDKGLFIVLVISLFAHYLKFIPEKVDVYVILTISIIGTIPVIISAFASLKSAKVSVDLLASIALVASLAAHEWASAAFINLMLTSARLFGYYTENKARAAIQKLLKLRPEKVKIKKGDEIMEIPASEVQVNDIVIVESGERLAVDGIAIEGEASLDQSSLTGESMPVDKTIDSEVYSSTIAVSGSLLVKATRVGKDTTLEKLIALVESSQNEKATIRTTADKFASWYIGLTLIVSIALFVVFRDFRLLLALLLVACADDIAVAVPMAFLASIGYAARRGVIIKGGAYLEGLIKAKTIIFDKTGTITSGKLYVENVTALNGFSRGEVLKFAGIAESVSEHPIAKSIIQYIIESKIHFDSPDEFEEFPGKGILVSHDGKKVFAGNEKFVLEQGLNISPDEKRMIKEAQDNGHTVTLIAYENKLAGFINSADKIREHIKTVIERLKNLGIKKVVMLTGDNEKVAKKIADEVGITEYHASLLPEDKLLYIKQNIASNNKVIMVGDGVNDAASLALADVGVSMGAIGSDAAIEASDIALMKDDLMEIPETIALAHYTHKVAKQDFILWGFSNTIGLILVLTHIIGPEGAAVFNFVTDFFPLLNSLRLFNLHLKIKI